MPSLIGSLQTLNQLLTAGIAITVFSLLLYALSFNLRDRVARSVAVIFFSLVVVSVGESIASIVEAAELLNLWVRIKWIGVIFLPPSYLHFSDALLATTGRPSRGRRRLLIRLTYLISAAFLLALLYPKLTGVVVSSGATSYLPPTPLNWLFFAYYTASMIWAWINFGRAYHRTITRTSQRRMTYLIAGATAPALSAFPFLTYSVIVIESRPLIFWLAANLVNIVTSVLIVVMAYAVAFFGVSWPDRVVKRRLFKWVMRGPVTASTVLAVTTLVRRAGESLGAVVYSAAVPIAMVGTLLLMQYTITMLAPIWERLLFYGNSENSLQLVQMLEERLLTSSDLGQFLEAILIAVCDHLQIQNAFVVVLVPPGSEMIITVGNSNQLEAETLTEELVQAVTRNNHENGDHTPLRLFTWGDFWLVPLFKEQPQPKESEFPLLGLIGAENLTGEKLDAEQRQALYTLSERAALALADRVQQQQVFNSLETLAPQVDWIQRLRASSRYDSADLLTEPDQTLQDDEFPRWVKDALSHYWGGPKLSKSPLMRLQIVQQAINEHDGSVNALRAILRQGIEQVKPEGRRRFTTEWILYNILEMKFMEGRKVRDVATRLAMSEADLYRKQRVAIDEVAHAIIAMEHEARSGQHPP